MRGSTGASRSWDMIGASTSVAVRTGSEGVVVVTVSDGDRTEGAGGVMPGGGWNSGSSEDIAAGLGYPGGSEALCVVSVMVVVVVVVVVVAILSAIPCCRRSFCGYPLTSPAGCARTQQTQLLSRIDRSGIQRSTRSITTQPRTVLLDPAADHCPKLHKLCLYRACRAFLHSFPSVNQVWAIFGNRIVDGYTSNAYIVQRVLWTGAWRVLYKL